jgi:hypothetical protein
MRTRETAGDVSVAIEIEPAAFPPAGRAMRPVETGAAMESQSRIVPAVAQAEKSESRHVPLVDLLIDTRA